MNYIGKAYNAGVKKVAADSMKFSNNRH